jgi:hypothetical protein
VRNLPRARGARPVAPSRNGQSQREESGERDQACGGTDGDEEDFGESSAKSAFRASLLLRNSEQ